MNTFKNFCSVDTCIRYYERDWFWLTPHTHGKEMWIKTHKPDTIKSISLSRHEKKHKLNEHKCRLSYPNADVWLMCMFLPQIVKFGRIYGQRNALILRYVLFFLTTGLTCAMAHKWGNGEGESMRRYNKNAEKEKREDTGRRTLSVQSQGSNQAHNIRLLAYLYWYTLWRCTVGNPTQHVNQSETLHEMFKGSNYVQFMMQLRNVPTNYTNCKDHISSWGRNSCSAFQEIIGLRESSSSGVSKKHQVCLSRFFAIIGPRPHCWKALLRRNDLGSH
jgi:hypothetical protein